MFYYTYKTPGTDNGRSNKYWSLDRNRARNLLTHSLHTLFYTEMDGIHWRKAPTHIYNINFLR